LTRKLDAMRQAGATLRDIVLTPLGSQDLGQLLADSLHCEPERVVPLVQLIHEKTTGNPFFAIQFISTLADDALLLFDYGETRWTWELNRIRAKGFTDNVVDLMVGKLNRLPVETQNALRQFACMAIPRSSKRYAWCTKTRMTRCIGNSGKPFGRVSSFVRKIRTDSSTTESRKQHIP
jgi:predicted ATPase